MPGLVDADVTNLSDHVAVLRRRWRYLVAGLVLGLFAGLGLSLLQTPIYTAESRLLLEPNRDTTGASVMDPDEVATQADVVVSSGVATRVIDELGLDDTPRELLRDVSVEVFERTRIVYIRAQRGQRDEAADVANAFANEYIAFRSEEAVAVDVRTRTAYLDELVSVRNELESAREDLAAAKTDAQTQSLEAKIQSLTAREAELSTEIAVNQAVETEPKPGGQLLRSAEPPDNASQPRPIRGALLGGLIGLILGLLVAYVRDRIDDRLRDESRLISTLGPIPILGRLPEDTRKNRSRPVALVAPQSPVSEALRALNTNVRFLLAAHAPARPGGATGTAASRKRGDILVVVSAVPGEGKTFVAVNLAVTAARMGLRVLLVDADLRSPSVSDQFSIQTPRGLAHVLTGQAELTDVLADSGIDQLRILGAGAVPPNPTELLAGAPAKQVWQQLRRMADLIIVDTAPVLRVADSLEIVRHANAVVFATRYRTTRVHQLQAGIDRIQQLGTPVNGAVWSALPTKGNQYGYGYGYTATDTDTPPNNTPTPTTPPQPDPHPQEAH